MGTGSLGGRLTNHQVYATICPINLGQAPSIPGHLEYEKLITTPTDPPRKKHLNWLG